MPKMDGKNSEMNMGAMDIGVVFDALNSSKRVRRSSSGNESVEPSPRKDDLVEDIGASSPDLGMQPWKPMNGHRGKFAKGNGMNQSSKPKSSRFASNSIEKEYSFVAQKRVGNENGKNEVIISPVEGSSFPFQRSDMRIKGKEVENKGNHWQNFRVLGPSISNKSMMKLPDDIVRSSTKHKEVYSYMDAGFKSRMKGNGIACASDLQGNVHEVMPKPSYLYPSGINIGQVKATSKENVEKIVCIDLSEGVSSHELNSNHLHSDKKGKLNLEDHRPKDLHHGEPTIRSSRAASLSGKEMVTIAEEQGSLCGFYQNLGWQKAHDFQINMNQLSHASPNNYKEKLSSSYLPEWSQETDIVDRDHAHVVSQSSYITAQDHISNPHHDEAFPDSVVNRRNHCWKQLVKGKNKCYSSISFGETSGSILNQPSNPQSLTGTSNLKLDKKNKNRYHGTIMEIDKLYPDARCCSSHGQQSGGVSDNSIASARQIESDEIFARELQEQFYHETTKFIDMEKFDATIAWSLQQDEDAKAATLAGMDHSNSVLFGDISSNFGCEVDLETRLDLLEAMEEVLENNGLEHDDITSNDSFNDADLETQLNLDDSIHQHVGSSEINNLPLSLIQNINNEEACAVCLEIPSVGETMRHLPCLHKFHKMCIDAWLKRKPLCPVCKFDIR